MKLLNCTLSFIDIIIFDLDEFDPGPIPGKSRLANYETRITNRIQQNKYSGLIVDIILDDYDREGADFSACVHFSASSLEEFVATVSSLVAKCYVDPNSFDAKYERYNCVLTEEDFNRNNEVDKRWIRKMQRCIARNDGLPHWDTDMWLL